MVFWSDRGKILVIFSKGEELLESFLLLRKKISLCIEKFTIARF
jgi:hypothetical protein